MYGRMKSYSYFLFGILFIVSCHKKELVKEIHINHWEFCETGKEWYSASVPGAVHLDLYDNNLIEDPFYRDNENKLQWIEETSWEYKSEFSLEEEFLEKKNIQLIFSGIDTYADVYLNDSLIKSCDNFFVTHRVKLDSVLKLNNELRFVFHPTVEKAKDIQKNNPYNLPGEERVYVRKPQFHFGWDWGPRFIGCGITEEVKLLGFNTAQISDYYLRTISVSDTKAKMRLELEISDLESEPYFIAFLGEEYPVQKEGNHIEFTVENPNLWWPRGYGDQHFYPLEISLLDSKGTVVDQIHEKYAIRQIDLVQDADDLGKGFKFQINGIDIYAKGANYIPLDFFHTRVDSGHYRKALNDVVEANMNMLRVWGGGMYEDEYFYNLCDSLGILVWQDFMFACAMYPGDDDFMESVEQEATQQLKRLRKHPAIALWCGNNEISEGWHRWGWQEGRSEDEIDALWMDYQNLFNKLLPNLVDTFTTSDYWESSPQYGRGDSKYQFTGDAHDWGVWHDAEPFEKFQNKVPRFMSEYGFQSFPEIDAMELYTLEEDLFLDSEVMKVHQKHPRGNSLIQEYMLRDYKAPAEFESFIYLSQVLQAEGMRVGMEAHRRARPYNMGTLYWQFNDCWPVASWSGRDYYGNWKALHYATQRAYEDLLISTMQSKDSLFIYLVNDHVENLEYDLLIEHMDYYGNRLGSKSTYTTIAGSSSSQVYAILLDDYFYLDSLENKSYLDIQLLQNGEVQARKFHHFVKPKDMDLPYTGISYKVEKDSLGFMLEIFSDAFMKDLMITSLHDGRFEDNYFDLPAKEHRRIRFYNEYPMEEFNTNSLTFYSIVDTYE